MGLISGRGQIFFPKSKQNNCLIVFQHIDTYERAIALSVKNNYTRLSLYNIQ